METPKRILLADDDAGFLFSLRIALQIAGFRVSEAGSGEEALGKLIEAQGSSDPFDLFVTDVELPMMSGLALVKEIAVRRIPVSVFLMTAGYCDTETWRGQAGEVPLTCLEKPFTAKELLTYIDDVLHRSEKGAA